MIMLNAKKNKKDGGLHIVRFMGGLANQLFQYSFYCKLKERFGDRVYADLSHYEVNHDHGGFKLSRFFIINSIDYLPAKYIFVTEKNYRSVKYSFRKNYYYVGFWQSRDYFPSNVDYIDNLRVALSNDLDLPEELIKKVKSEVSVSVHVRRGDYVDNAMHGNIATKAYYQNAIYYIKKNVKYAEFFVFSDDISWCKENLDFGDSCRTFVCGNEDKVHADIVLMSKCKHNIISNSSFSWWAKTLNDNDNSILLVPPRWFNEEINVEALDVCEGIVIGNIPQFESRNDIAREYIVSLVDESMLERCIVSIMNAENGEFDIIVVGLTISKASEIYLEQCAKISGIDIKIKLGKNWEEAYYSMKTEATALDYIYIDSNEYLKESFLTDYHNN